MARQIAITLIGSALLLGFAEGVIRWTGLAEGCSIEFGGDGRFVCDPILGFRVNPAREVRGQALNSSGFRTHEFREKLPGLYRILALGDSCTFGALGSNHVRTPYPLQLEQLIFVEQGPGKAEVLNAGQGGYSSYHGVMLLRTRLRSLDPDLITVRYGWNDLFASPGWGHSREPEGAVRLAVEDALLRTALYAFLKRVRMEVRGRIRDPSARAMEAFESRDTWAPSIPLEEYKRNLQRIIELAHARGADVWLLTAPHNPSPDDLATRKIEVINRLEWKKLVDVLDSYNDTVREVGAELGAPVIDMAAIYTEHPKANLFDGDDAIHPNQAGHRLEARVLYSRLVASGALR
jgi:lysophospholipase L1-like esterase